VRRGGLEYGAILGSGSQQQAAVLIGVGGVIAVCKPKDVYNSNRIKTAYLLAMFDPSRTAQPGEARLLPRGCSSGALKSCKSCIASQKLCT
jgi:hypothetical protein